MHGQQNIKNEENTFHQNKDFNLRKNLINATFGADCTWCWNFDTLTVVSMVLE